MTKIVLVGPPRIGKTTITKAVVAKLSGKCAGFYTEEIREDGERVGFQLVTVDNASCKLAHRDIVGHIHVGKYGIDLACLESAGVGAIRKGLKTRQPIVIDEIGKMEILSRSFRFAVLDALDSKSPVVATMLVKRNPFCDKIRTRRDVEVLEVNELNRDELVGIVLGKLAAYIT